MFIIYSVFQSSQSELNNVRAHSREQAWLRSQGIPYTECLGVYQGKREYSLQVGREYSHLIKERALLAKQECILIVNSESQAMLVYPNSEVKSIGRFRRVTGSTSNDCTYIKGIAYEAA